MKKKKNMILSILYLVYKLKFEQKNEVLNYLSNFKFYLLY